ncbi:uncharacterized protein [Pyrus communis]|uniref:uncharacterized protein n=1 Tax=Pyrus communis TaxID=23211 RepID=UPI0035C15B84
MSWLARSLADSLRLDEDGDAENDVVPNESAIPTTTDNDVVRRSEIESSDKENEDDDQTRGVREDLDEFKQTLTRQFWGVASFLAPPPPPPPPPYPSLPSSNRTDPPDIGRSEPPDQLAMDFGEGEEEEDCAVGVTEEVLAFARNIAMHPETWLDFPLDEEEDLGDFDMSDAQQEHATVIEHLAPRLAALRFELCPCHMSESYFWKVYFVLLHSRLNKQDAEILSTPQVMEARAMWMQELHCYTALEDDQFGRNPSFLKDHSNILHEDCAPVSSCSVYYEDKMLRTYPCESTMSPTAYETEKHPVESDEIAFIDKSVIEEKPIIKSEEKNLTVGPSSKMLDNIYENDDDDDWPEEDSELDGYSGTAIHAINEDDISFSDLEDDDFLTSTKLKIVSKEIRNHQEREVTIGTCSAR